MRWFFSRALAGVPLNQLFILDVSGDGFLDAYELEAIFNPELEKVYNLADPNEDKNEMEEERQNMREHVLKEVDSGEFHFRWFKINISEIGKAA